MHVFQRLFARACMLVLAVTAPAHALEWPHAANAAVTLSFDLDAETLWWDDARTMQGQPGPLSQGRYGPTVALPAILDVLRQHGIKATFFVPAWVATSYPDEIRRIVADGHEIAAHGVRHVAPNTLEPREELRRLRHSIETLTKIAGYRPTGYRAPSWALGEKTLQFAANEGFLYSSNLMDRDLPYLHTAPPGLVELPVSWVLDDAPHFWFDESSWNKTIRSAQEVLELWKEEFAAAYATHGYFGLTMHPQFIGRPARLHMLDELLTWIESFEGVWITDCRSLARHVQAAD